MKHSEVYLNGEDNGWMKKQNFWFDPEHEHGFAIQDLDSLYPEKYFETDHVKPETVENYVRLVKEYYVKINNGSKPELIIEFGSGGGWFAKKFIEDKIGFVPFEGTNAGILACKKKGVTASRFDFRTPYKPFDFGINTPILALCTEVAEHIEPPFSATLVKSLCDAAPLIWFSFEEPNTNAAHVHHCNEMPAKFWINLFEFFGYGAYKLPQEVYDACEGRGMYIFYNKSIYAGNQFLQS